MKYYALADESFEDICREEIKRFIGVQAKADTSVIEFEIKNKSNNNFNNEINKNKNNKNENNNTNETKKLLNLINFCQSARRVCLFFGKFDSDTFASGEDLNFKEGNVNFDDFFSGKSFKVDVENVKGQENRFEIAGRVAGHIFKCLEKEKPLSGSKNIAAGNSHSKNIMPVIELKKPDILVNVFFNGKYYYVGADICGIELNSRAYRVFPHQASFKGDFAYFFVRRSMFKPENKLLVGFAKDGAIAIEAALWANNLPARNQAENNFFLNRADSSSDASDMQKEMMLSENEKKESKNNEKECRKIYAFDESKQNIIAARKNCQLAGAKNFLEIMNCSLDELDVKFAENEFDNVIFHVTSKDEDKLNEMYYQAHYILKKKGFLLLIGRNGWEITVSDKFKLSQAGEIKRGESVHKYWLLEKK